HVRATPAITAPASSRKPGLPAQFDMALISKTPKHRQQAWGMLNGLHVAQVHVIFKLPLQFGQYSCPLAYVEWFTPLQGLDLIVGMYQVSRSTQ
ncbi:hypothetical protein PAXINDRAFT_42531, partial [Paxillus involutus ATCC 200175]